MEKKISICVYVNKHDAAEIDELKRLLCRPSRADLLRHLIRSASKKFLSRKFAMANMQQQH